MAFANFGELKTEILDWLDRSNDTETVTAIPKWVALAEADMRREVVHRNVNRNVSFSLSTAEVSLPSDLKALDSLYITDNPYEGQITLVSPGRISDLRRDYPTASVPKWAAVVSGTLLLAPTPQQAFTASLIYTPTVTALVNDADANWFLTNHPDLYLYGSLIHSAPWLESEADTLAGWVAGYERALQGMEKERTNREYGGPLIARPRRALG